MLSRPDVPRPSTAACDKARLLLERALGPSKVLTDRDACEGYVRDESEALGVVPDAVVLAENADDILAALRVAREAEVPITPRAAGTGRTGGSVGHGWQKHSRICSGEGGIRTRGRLLTYARLASGYLRPLGHLSGFRVAACAK